MWLFCVDKSLKKSFIYVFHGCKSIFINFAFQKQYTVYEWHIYKLSCWSVPSVKKIKGIQEAIIQVQRNMLWDAEVHSLWNGLQMGSCSELKNKKLLARGCLFSIYFSLTLHCIPAGLTLLKQIFCQAEQDCLVDGFFSNLDMYTHRHSQTIDILQTTSTF